MRIKEYDPNRHGQMFRFEPVHNNPTINGSTMIENKLSGKYLDVPSAAVKKGTQPVQ